jgi:hypothetical protein
MNSSRKKKYFFHSFCLSLFFSTIPYLFFTPYFETVDDPFIILAAKGWGIVSLASPYILNANIFLGFALKHLYAFCDSIPWHSLILITAFFLGFWAYLIVLIDSKTTWEKLVFFLLGYLSVDLYLLVWLHFTSAAMLACQGGLFLLLNSVKKRTWSNRSALLAGLCLCWGSLLRPNAFFLTILSFLPLFYFFFPQIKIYPFRKKMLMALAGILVSVALPILANHMALDKKPDWRAFYHSAPLFEHLIDFRHINHNDKNTSLLTSLHWSYNELDIFQNWYFQDKEKCNDAVLKTLDDSLPRLREDDPNYPLDGIYRSTQSQACILMILCCLFFLSRPNAIKTVILTVWMFAIHTFMFYFMKAPQWIYTPLLLLCLHNCFLLMDSPFQESPFKITDGRQAVGLKLIIGILACIQLFNTLNIYSLKDRMSQNIETQWHADIAKLNPHPDKLYIGWHNTIPYEHVNAFDDWSRFKNMKIFQLHGFQNAPTAQGLLAEFGITDLDIQMINNPNVFVLCNPYEGSLYSQHIMEKYAIKIEPHPIFFGRLFQVYQLLGHKVSDGVHG